MKIVNKLLTQTADVNSARGTIFNEFWKLVLSAIVLLMGLFFITGLLVDVIVTRISFETEARLFKAVQIPGKKPEESEYQERLETARGILQKLNAKKGVPPLPYLLVLVEHDDPNAFAFPGGTIGITSGLLDVLSDNIEIAFVLGHELGHFYNRDHLRGMGRAIGFSVLTAVIFGSSIGADSFGNIMNLALQRSYSQEREKRADRFGMKLVYSVYGKVNGTQRMFKILKERKKIPKWAYMFATHPSPEERIRDLERYSDHLTE